MTLWCIYIYIILVNMIQHGPCGNGNWSHLQYVMFRFSEQGVREMPLVSMFRRTFWWTVEDYAALSSVDCFGGIQAPTHSCQPQQHALHMSHSGWVCPEFLKSEWEPVANHLNHWNLLITHRSPPQTGPNVGHLGCSAGAFPRFPAVRTSIMCQKQGSQTMQTWAWDTHSSNLSIVLSAMEGLSF